jgi:hypothetical protein
VDIALDRRFLASAHALGAHAERVLAFLEKVALEEYRAGLNLERIERSADSKLCSLRVNEDLRAIGVIDHDRLVLLYVAEHDDAYRWAQTHRTAQGDGTLALLSVPDAMCAFVRVGATDPDTGPGTGPGAHPAGGRHRRSRR